MKYYKYKTDIIDLYIFEEDGAIVMVQMEESSVPEGVVLEETPLIKETYRQLSEYCEGKRKEFDVPIAFVTGTEFQKRVWRALCDIPYGEVRSYQDIAIAVGSPGAVRAVGGANKRNPVSIIVPCHRVIQKNGALGGYGGYGPLVVVKEKLLELEKKYK
ncbi:MAG: methylated-DNA--[Firmicutes bacterium]|nr:methylated-DNA--[protein]-cysteine S-methyltransferase [Bacillota bacterium]